MFEAIAIRRSTDPSSNDGVDIGSLAESILFYGRTNLLIGRATMRKLLRVCGPETTLRLVEEGYVQARYLYWDAAVYTENSGTPDAVHLPTAITVGTSFEQELRDIWEQELGRTGRLRRLRNRFIEAAPLLDRPDELRTDLHDALLDDSLLESAARAVLQQLAPAYRIPSGFYFRAEPAAEGRVKIATNLDVATASRSYRAFRGQDAGSLEPATVLAELTDSQVDLYVAAQLGTDTVASSLSSHLLSLLTEKPLRSNSENKQLLALNEIALDGRSIREAINEGSRSLEDFFPILDSSRQFREWVRDVPDDASLAKSYFDECVKDSWVEKLPVRAMRWAVVLLASLHMPLGGGAALAGFDSMLLDRLATGWRPNRFIDRQLGPFVS